MDQAAAKSWFGRLSRIQKIECLLNVMFELTIVTRSVFHDYRDDSETHSRLFLDISELNHRLISAATQMMRNEPTYPDDAIIEMLFNPSRHPELSPYFPFVLEKVIRRLPMDIVVGPIVD